MLVWNGLMFALIPNAREGNRDCCAFNTACLYCFVEINNKHKGEQAWI